GMSRISPHRCDANTPIAYAGSTSSIRENPNREHASLTLRLVSTIAMHKEALLFCLTRRVAKVSFGASASAATRKVVARQRLMTVGRGGADRFVSVAFVSDDGPGVGSRVAARASIRSTPTKLCPTTS